jgi:hypothetical protein
MCTCSLSRDGHTPSTHTAFGHCPVHCGLCVAGVLKMRDVSFRQPLHARLPPSVCKGVSLTSMEEEKTECRWRAAHALSHWLTRPLCPLAPTGHHHPNLADWGPVANNVYLYVWGAHCGHALEFCVALVCYALLFADGTWQDECKVRSETEGPMQPLRRNICGHPFVLISILPLEYSCMDFHHLRHMANVTTFSHTFVIWALDRELERAGLGHFHCQACSTHALTNPLRMHLL